MSKNKPKTVAELRDFLGRIDSGSWGISTKTERTVVTLFFAEMLMKIEQALASQPTPSANNGRKKRPPTEWQKFFAAGMKAGKSPAEIGAEWRGKQ